MVPGPESSEWVPKPMVVATYTNQTSWSMSWFGSKIIDSGWGSKIMVWGQKMTFPGPSKKGSKNDDFHGVGQKMVNPMGGSQKNGQKRGQKSILSLLCKGPAAWGSVTMAWPD